MGSEINAAKDYFIKIFEELTTEYKDYNFHFGFAFYKDKIDYKSDKDEYFLLIDNMKNLKNNISHVLEDGGW